MDGCVYPYRHVAPAPAATVHAGKASGYRRDAVVIGAFVTPLKLSQRCLALWRDILLRVPGAMLAFSPVHPALRTVFLRIGAAAGIDAGRIAFVPQGRDDAENQARYRLDRLRAGSRARTAASTGRWKRSTWVCRWSRSSAAAMRSARRIRS